MLPAALTTLGTLATSAALLSTGACTSTAGNGTELSAFDLQSKLNEIVTAQGNALLAADKDGFTRVAKQPGVREELLLRYRNMTAMRVSKARSSVSIPQRDTEPGYWKAELTIDLCFVAPSCREEQVTEQTRWTVGADGPELMSIVPATDGGPRPWQVTELEVAHGDRILVAAPKQLADSLSRVLGEAKGAASVADSFSPRDKLDYYRVFVADDKAWKSWYGGLKGAGAATITVSDTRTDVVLDGSELQAPDGDVPGMLRNQMTRATALRGRHFAQGNWWLIEGLAGFAATGPGAGALPAVKQYLRGQWDGKLPADVPDGVSGIELLRRHQIAFLAVKCLDTKHGRQGLLGFFDRVVKNKVSYESASLSILSAKPWATVEAECVSFIRNGG